MRRQQIELPLWEEKSQVYLMLPSRTGLILSSLTTLSWVWPGQGKFSPDSRKGAQLGRLTPPGQTEQGIPYHVPSCWIPVGGGSWARGTLSRFGRAQRWFGPGEWLSGSCGLCWVFSSSVSLLLLFPLFAVLLNCPYPDPSVSTCFFPFSSTLRQGEGRPRGAFLPAAAKP